MRCWPIGGPAAKAQASELAVFFASDASGKLNGRMISVDFYRYEVSFKLNKEQV